MADGDPETDSPAPGLLQYAGPRIARPRRLAWPVAVVLALVVAGLAIRLAYAAVLYARPATFAAMPDQYEYFTLGQSLIHGQGLRFVDSRFGMLRPVVAYRMPAYPLLVAACGGKVIVVRAVQAALDGSCIVAVFLIGRRLIGDAAGVLAAAAVAFHPYLIFFSSTLLSETMFASALIWGIYLLLQDAAKLRGYGIGIMVLSVYIRPSSIGLGVVAAACTFSQSPHCARLLRHNLIACLAAAVGLVVVLMPWGYRNHRELGRWIWTTTNTGITAYDSFHPTADGSSDQSVLLDAARFVPAAVVPSGLDERSTLLFKRRHWDGTLALKGELGRNDFFARAAWDFAREHPWRCVELAAAKLARFWSPVPLSADFGGRRLYVAVGGLYVVPLFALAAIGVWRGKLSRRAKLILLLPAIYFSAVHCVFVGSLRYRVPCDVPLAVLAAAGVMSFVRIKTTHASAVAA